MFPAQHRGPTRDHRDRLRIADKRLFIAPSAESMISSGDMRFYRVNAAKDRFITDFLDYEAKKGIQEVRYFARRRNRADSSRQNVVTSSTRSARQTTK